MSGGGSEHRDAQRKAAASKPVSGCDSAVQSCPLAYLVVIVKTSSGTPVDLADVRFLELSARDQTDLDGRYDVGQIEPGFYTVYASKWLHFTPDGDNTAQATVLVMAGETRTVELVLDSVEVHMHVDADRDGKADDDRTGYDKWEWGAGKKGAIILCNNDGDGAAAASDNADDKVNTGNDTSELAPLEFRRIGAKAPPDMKAFLKVSKKDFIRIFDNRAAGTVEVIGPTSGKDKYEFPNLNFAKREFGIEALRYADGAFSDDVKLTFEVHYAGALLYTEDAVLKVAPWMMPSHLDKAETVYVVKFDARLPAGMTTNSRFRIELETFVKGAGCTVVEHANGDRWMQDCMEFGYSSLPGAGFRTNSAAFRKRPLKDYPRSLRKADLGYHEEVSFADARTDTTFDSTGNLECTPPVTSKAGKRYPWGRIYYGPGAPGAKMNADVVAFLKKQTVQAPIEVDTSWLLVGHVDELMSIVPGGPKGFKLVLASPKRAYAILNAHKAANGASKLLTARRFPQRDMAGTFIGWADAEVSISNYLSSGIPALGLDPADLKTFNDDCQAKLDTTKNDLKKELGLDEADIIHLPVLFHANHLQPNKADALTGDIVNMLVLNKTCIPPKPFGPVVGGKDLFEEEMRKALKPLGLTVNFLDDWYEYHVAKGEVHCGTNTLRAQPNAKWWEFKP
jgi:hypothetical protein